MQCRAFLIPVVALLIALMLAPGCRLKPRAAMPALPPEDEIPIAATGLRQVQVILHTRESAKPGPDPVTVRMRWENRVVLSETVGRGERWERGSSRNVNFTFSPPLDMGHPGVLALEVTKPDTAHGRAPWVVEVQAVGRLTDGTVLELLPRTESVRIGGGDATESLWMLRRR